MGEQATEDDKRLVYVSFSEFLVPAVFMHTSMMFFIVWCSRSQTFLEGAKCRV